MLPPKGLTLSLSSQGLAACYVQVQSSHNSGLLLCFTLDGSRNKIPQLWRMNIASQQDHLNSGLHFWPTLSHTRKWDITDSTKCQPYSLVRSALNVHTGRQQAGRQTSTSWEWPWWEGLCGQLHHRLFNKQQDLAYGWTWHHSCWFLVSYWCPHRGYRWSRFQLDHSYRQSTLVSTQVWPCRSWKHWSCIVQSQPKGIEHLYFLLKQSLLLFQFSNLVVLGCLQLLHLKWQSYKLFLFFLGTTKGSLNKPLPAMSNYLI